MMPKIGPGNELAIKKSVRIKPYTTPTTPLAASERSRRQDGNADARPGREPSPQRTPHRDDDNEHDERCRSQADCQHGLGTRHRTSSWFVLALLVSFLAADG
jgi:hypothetical protein